MMAMETIKTLRCAQYLKKFQQRVSNIVIINIERSYANSAVDNDTERIIDVFSRRNGRDSYLLYRY